MPDISDTIEPGSTEYGDRQVLTDRMRQISAQAATPVPTKSNAPQRAQDRLAAGPVSDKPVTSGMSVGPGATPSTVNDPLQSSEADRYRMLAQNARNPYLRHLARKQLEVIMARGKR